MRQLHRLPIHLPLIAAILLVGLLSSARSEEPYVADTSSQACNICWLEKAPPGCCWTIIFESGLRLRASESNVRAGKGDGLATFDFGFMRNLNPHTAMGGSFYISGDDDGSRFGLRYRYRRWLTSRSCIDLSPGILVAGADNYQDFRFPGLIASISVAAGGLISIDAYFEMYRYHSSYYDFASREIRDRKGTVRAFYLGGTGRSWMAFAMPVAVIVIFIIDPPDFSFGNS